MKELAHKQMICKNPTANTTPSAAALVSTSTMHKINSSQAIISKPKPKIRIIHIFAPEIIKTDAANFRELVQRLTGKQPTDRRRHHREQEKNPTKKSTRLIRRQLLVKEPSNLIDFLGSNEKMELAVIRAGSSGFHAAAGPQPRTITGSFEQKIADWGTGDHHRDPSQDDGYNFLGGFVDDQFDGFMQEINHQFPFFEGSTDQHDQMDDSYIWRTPAAACLN